MTVLLTPQKSYADVAMKLIDTVLGLFLVFIWVAGIVISKGFWSCLAATTLPPWAIYLVVEKVLIHTGFI